MRAGNSAHHEPVRLHQGAYAGTECLSEEGSQLPAGGDGSKPEGGLDHAELVADAFAGTAAEGDERISRRRWTVRAVPSIRVEAFGVEVQIGSVVDEIGTEDDA